MILNYSTHLIAKLWILFISKTIKGYNIAKILFIYHCVLLPLSAIFGQNTTVTLTENQIPLIKAFESIEKQTQLSIAYNRNKLDVNQKVNTNFKNASVNTVMQKLLQGTGFRFRREGSYIIITTSVTDNKVHGSSTVKGKIVDSNGEPIIGASVVEKGTTNGTITDIDGNFVLSMPNDKGLLNVSYVGYLSQTVKTEVINLEYCIERRYSNPWWIGCRRLWYGEENQCYRFNRYR